MRLNRQISLVKKDIQKRFPGCNYTVRILLWDDDTTSVECRHGTLEKLYISRYYKNTLTYDEIDMHRVDNILIDETGKEYFPIN